MISICQMKRPCARREAIRRALTKEGSCTMTMSTENIKPLWLQSRTNPLSDRGAAALSRPFGMPLSGFDRAAFKQEREAASPLGGQRHAIKRPPNGLPARKYFGEAVR